MVPSIWGVICGQRSADIGIVGGDQIDAGLIPAPRQRRDQHKTQRRAQQQLAAADGRGRLCRLRSPQSMPVG